MSFEIDHYAEWVAALDKHEAELKNGTAPRWEGIRTGQDLRMALRHLQTEMLCRPHLPKQSGHLGSPRQTRCT